MASRMILALLVLAVFGTAGAIVMYSRVPLEESVARATVVAHVRITRIEDRKFQFRGKPYSCGTDYYVDVLETFKGRPLRQRSFAVDGQPHPVFWLEVQPGDELLVLLQARRLNDYPSWEATDVIGPPPTPSELACRRTLSPWDLFDGQTGGFRLMPPQGAGADAPLQFLYMDHRTSVSATLKSLASRYNRMCDDCVTPMMVPWDRVRSEIRDWTSKH